MRLIRPQSCEVMQKRNDEAFADMQGMNVIADDLIIAARNETEHESIMHQVLQCTSRKNVMVNAGNIQFKVTVSYMGNIVTKDGMRPDPEKIDAIIRIPEPTGKHVIVRLIGMITQLSQYIPNEPSITQPPRSLLKLDAKWHWQPDHDAVMDEIRKTLARNTVLAFYRVLKPITIQEDAPRVDWGAVSCSRADLWRWHHAR